MNGNKTYTCTCIETAGFSGYWVLVFELVVRFTSTCTIPSHNWSNVHVCRPR